MNKIVEELKKAKVFYIATIDGNKPRVRPFASVAEYEGHAYLCSGNFKEFYKQIKENNHIEITAMYNGPYWLRISGALIEDNRLEVQQAILDDETGPKGIYTPGDGKFVTFRLDVDKALKCSFTGNEEIKE